MPAFLSRLITKREAYMVAIGREEAPLPASNRDGVEARPVHWENVNDVKILRSEKVAHSLRQLLVDDAVGVYAYADGHFAGHFWAVHSGPRVKRLWGGVDFGPDEVLLCWGWVDHKLRGRGVFQAMIFALVTELRSRFGPIRIVADVPVDPLASLVAHHRMGFHLTGRLEYVRILGRLWSQRTEPLGDDDLETILMNGAR